MAHRKDLIEKRNKALKSDFKRLSEKGVKIDAIYIRLQAKYFISFHTIDKVLKGYGSQNQAFANR